MSPQLKAIARVVLGDWSVFRIYEFRRDEELVPDLCSDRRVVEVEVDAVMRCVDATLADQASYCGPDSHAFACHDEGRMAGLCFYWHGERYLKRNYWPLAPHEAKLVQIITAPQWRGQGVARALIAGSARSMFDLGFERLYARVWWSHRSSQAAFVAAGWRHVATVAEFDPLRRGRALRFRFGQRPRG